MNQTIHDLFRRYGCQVVIETYEKLPDGQDADVDLSDRAAIDRALSARVSECIRQASRHKPRLCIVLVSSTRGRRFSENIWSSILVNEESDRLRDGIKGRLEGKFGPGMPDTLAYIGAFLEQKQPDQDRLQGRWVATKLVTPSTNTVLTGEKAKLFYAIFAADRVTIGRGETKTIDGRFSLNVDANPRRIEIFTIQDGKRVSQPSGIYSLRGDTLTLRLFDPDRLHNPAKLPPPTDFENIGKEDKNEVLFVLRRAEPGHRAEGAASVPHVRDEARYWSDAEQARMNEAIQGISRRFPCQVFVETYVKMSPEFAKDSDDNGRKIGDRVSEWTKKRGIELHGSKPGMSILILSCKEAEHFRVFIERTAGHSLTKEESEQAQRFVNQLSDGLYQRLGGKVVQGMPDALKFIGDTLKANQELVAVRPTPPPSPPSPERPQTPERPPAQDSDGNTAADLAAFKSAAQSAGLSAADVKAILADRGPASYKDLTDFLKDQVKDGRKGNDLKRDLEVFIRVFKEKVGK